MIDIMKNLSKMNGNTVMLQMIRFFVYFLILYPAICISFATAQIPAPAQSQPVALTGGTIHTVSGDVIENGMILFEDGVITAIGTDIELPENTRVDDISSKHVYPALIDAFSRIGIFEIGMVSMTEDINEQGSVNPNVKVERAFNPGSRHIGIARSAGIGVVFTSPGGGLISGQSAAMLLDGWNWEEMTLKSGAGMILNWPSPGNEERYTENLRELRTVFADARAYYTARQVMMAGGVARHDLDTRWEAMIPVFEREMPVVVNANDVRQIQDAIVWAQEEDVRLVILGGRDAHLVTEQLKAFDIPVIITEVLASPNRAWEGYDSRYSLPAKLHRAGVTFAISGEPDAANANRLPYEAGAAAAYGLPVEEAIKAITLYPAEILGIRDRVGALEPGMHATLIITDGNPVEYATQVEQVYIRGRKSDMNDMHRQLYQKYRQKVEESRESGSQ
jgi:imidazolonepropionase-like amidohydrolase